MKDELNKNEVVNKIKRTLELFQAKNPCGGGKITLIDRRYVMLSTDYFPFDITRDLEELFNAAGDTLLYKGGERIGKDLYAHYLPMARTYGVDIWDIISAVGWFFGWGTGTVIESGENDGRYRVRVYDSFEADSFLKRAGNTEKPVCHFMRGVLNGIVESIEGRKYSSKEDKCLAKGDGFCEFVFEPFK